MDNTSVPSVSASPRFRGEMLNRIYRIWLFRKLMPVLIAEVLIFGVLSYGFMRFVFIRRVIENGLNVFSQNPSGIFSFTIAAFLHAPLLTQLITIGVVALAALVIRLITQGILRFILVKENYFARVGR
ncbi:MAG: hypothetical protein WAP52_01420 [Candidatus Sungiibacteriota bacterium]